MVCTAKSLAAAVNCFSCLSKKQLKAIKIALMCGWTNVPVGQQAPFNPQIAGTSGASLTFSWSQATVPDTNVVEVSRDGGATWNTFQTVSGATTSVVDNTGMGANTYWSYRVHAVTNGKSSATASAGVGNSIAVSTGTSYSAPDMVLAFGVTFTGATLTSISMPRLAIVTGAWSSNNSDVTTLNLNSLASVTGAFSPRAGAPISLPALTTVGGALLVAYATSFSAPLLQTVGSANFQSTCSFATLSLPSLTSSSGILNAGVIGLTSVSMPALTTVGGNMNMPHLTSIISFSAPNLISVGGILDLSVNPIASLNLNSLSTISGNCNLFTNSAITSLNLGSLTSVGGNFAVNGCASLTSITFGTLVFPSNKTHTVNGDALGASSVNNFLNQLNLSVVTGCTINTAGGTNSAPTVGPPNGITAAAALIPGNVSVTTN